MVFQIRDRDVFRWSVHLSVLNKCTGVVSRVYREVYGDAGLSAFEAIGVRPTWWRDKSMVFIIDWVSWRSGPLVHYVFIKWWVCDRVMELHLVYIYLLLPLLFYHGVLNCSFAYLYVKEFIVAGCVSYTGSGSNGGYYASRYCCCDLRICQFFEV